MINYIVQVVLFQVLFLLVYDLFFQRETFFRLNRLYLLLTPVLSFLIPLIKFESFKNSIPEEYMVVLPEVVINPQVVIEQVSPEPVKAYTSLTLLFYAGAFIFLIVFLYKLFGIYKLLKGKTIVKKKGYNLVFLDHIPSAFSFLNYIFVSKSLSEKEEQQIIQHELVHCRQYHTLDLLFFELFKIIMWFNPLIYIYQHRITLMHEYISDAEVVKISDKKMYFDKLLAETFRVQSISFINQFYKQSLIKKRIAMITKNKSHQLKQLKYLLLVPILASMLLYSSCEQTNETNDGVSKLQKQLVTLYRNDNDGGVKSMTGSEETYFDIYSLFNDQQPNIELQSLNYNNLSALEKQEYDRTVELYKSMQNDAAKIESSLHCFKNGRKVIVQKVTIPEREKKDYTNAEDVPFSVVSQTPTFSMCTGSNEELKDCLNKTLQTLVATNFDAEIVKGLDLESGRTRIYVQFKITKVGGVEVIGVRAAHSKLEEEARRVVENLPKMIPGMHNGKPVNVLYMLPISINVE